MTLGGFELEDQPALTSMPQKAASASAYLTNLVGKGYKITNYLGSQVVKGVNYIFIAQQTTISASPERRLVVVKINEFDGEYKLDSLVPLKYE